MDTTSVSAQARALGSAIEPVTAQVYFSPECHANYAELGFDGSPGNANGVALPDGPAYFTSRGSVMGQVAGQVVAAAFAVFNPEVVTACVSLGWSRTDAASICAARDAGGVGQLERLVGSQPDGVQRVRDLLLRAVSPLRPEGRPLFAGLSSRPMPPTTLGEVWRLGDLLREYRGDSHTAAWISAGLTATEIGLLSELYWGLPMRSYSRTRAWSEEHFGAAETSLRSAGLLEGDGLSMAGRTIREQIEVATDLQMVPVLTALGDEVDELIHLLQPWGKLIRDGHGYPAAGPHDLARHAAH